VSEDAAAALARRLADIPAGHPLRLLPVRHHSPACAWQLRALIRRERPRHVLIEGPVEATALARFMGMSGAQPPLAVYACLPARDASTPGPRAFFPFAAFSPEWVALREGLRCGAQVRFIDRPAAALLEEADADGDIGDGLGGDNDTDDGPSIDVDPLLRDDLAARAQRVVAAAGSHDFDHWWDRHFEAGGHAVDPDTWFQRLQQWCLLLRERPGPGDCSARERAMAAQVAAAVATGESTLAVVGGLHVEAIAVLLAASEPLPLETGDGRAECYLVPYSLPRLDSAHTRAAGLPDTGYYQQWWDAAEAGAPRPERSAAEAAAVRVANGLRERGEIAGVPDAIEAVLMAERLAALRNVPLGRAEVLDALDGVMPGDGGARDTRRAQLRRLLATDAVGRLPKQYPRAPLVEDFRRRATALGLPLLPASTDRALDLYRSAKHREVSRLLHQLAALGAPYAELRAGPDFVTGSDLARVRERWRLAWHPEVDARLTECQHLGAHVADAALASLLLRARRHPDEAPTCLLEGLRMGLHARIEPLLDAAGHWVDREGALPVLARGLAQLAAAERAREVLSTADLPGLPDLLARAYLRALALLPWLGRMDADATIDTSEALATLNTLASESWADLPALLDALQRIVDMPLPALLRGRIAAILCVRGRLSRTESATRLRATLDAGLLEAQVPCDYLLGFLPLARHVLLGDAALIDAFDSALSQWDEDLFLQVLPGLRLAFTALKPREAASLLQSIRGGDGDDEDTHAPALEATHHAALSRLRSDTARAAALWGLHD
jgi:hypothetical protein